MSQLSRYEIKFVANEINLSIFNQWLFSETDFFKKFPDRTINSIYFDDNDFSSVRDNLSGIAQRKKYRLRWYGDEHTETTKPILETKIKNGRLGSKEYFEVLELNRNTEHLNIQQIQDIVLSQNSKKDLFINKKLNASLIVLYKRKYFENNAGLRITIDSDIFFSDPCNSKSIQNHDKLLFNKSIIELKFDLHKKNLASNLIRNLNLVPSRHSKYLSGLAMLGKVNYL